MIKRKMQRGFTLIELVMVVVIMGIVAAILGPFLVQPFTAYQALSRRTELVSQLNSAMDQMIKDINLAVPNSVREDGDAQKDGKGITLEMMNVQAFGRYRYSDARSDANALTPAQADNSFNVLGDLNGVSFPDSNTNTIRAIVNNVDATQLYSAAANANGDLGIITPVSTKVVSGLWSNERTINFKNSGNDAPFKFDLIGTGSPSNRVYFSNGPILYFCTGANADGAGQIRRWTGYSIQAAIPDPVNGAGSLVLDNVSACSFTYDPGTEQRGGLVTINIQLTIQGESVRLIQQVQVPNAP